MDELLRELDELLRELDELLRELDELLRELDELPGELDELLRELDELLRELDELLRELDELLRELDELLRELDELLRESDELLRELDELPGELDELPGELDELSGELDELLRKSGEETRRPTLRSRAPHRKVPPVTAMRRNPLTLLLALLVVLGGAQLALPDDDPFPVDILMIVAKASAGMPPSEADQKRLQEFASQDKNEPVNGVTYGDVMAIIHTCTQTGQRPPNAEIARMRQWAAGMKARKQKMIDDAKKLQKELEKAKPSGGATGNPANPTHEARFDPHVGTVEFKCHETATTTATHGKDTADFSFDATYPVRFDVRDAGEDLTVNWTIDMRSTKTITGSYSASTTSTSDSGSSKLDGQCAIDAPANKGTSFATGSVAVVKAGTRPYFKGAATTTTVCELQGTQTTTAAGGKTTEKSISEKTSASAPMPASLDDTGLLDSPFNPLAQVPEAYRAMVKDKMKQNMDPAVEKAATEAKCTFDAASFRSGWEANKPFSVPITYEYTLTKTRTKGSDQSTVVAQFTTTVTLHFGNAP